ncbi:MAG: 6-phosphofructokinase [Bacteroidales bacterium]
MNKIKKIGVLTSGGDSPGMNAAIRAVTRAGLYNKLEVVGIMHGYHGMINAHFKKLESPMVSDIIQKGGTILKSTRDEEFKTEKGRKKAYDSLKKDNIDGVVVIGGDGTFKGAKTFTEEFDIPVIGIPGTIDNDLYGTDYTIGYDSALNTIVTAVDKIRDTASSHNRLFFVEVMGRDAGFLALRSGIACGAEAILIPEVDRDVQSLREYLKQSYRRKKYSNIIIVSEGDESGGAFKIANKTKNEFPQYDTRVTVLGHIQRGGCPSAFDRVTASKMGIAAVDALLDNQNSIMIGMMNREVVQISFNKTVKHHKNINLDLLNMIQILSI